MLRCCRCNSKGATAVAILAMLLLVCVLLMLLVVVNVLRDSEAPVSAGDFLRVVVR